MLCDVSDNDWMVIILNIEISRSIDSIDPWEPDFYGVFFDRDGETVFYYMDGMSIASITMEELDSKVIWTCPRGGQLTLPCKWTIFTEKEKVYLMTASDRGVDLDQRTMVRGLSAQARIHYESTIPSEKHFEGYKIHFADHTISQRGNWGYTCEKNGHEIWSFAGRAYQYTDIFMRNGRIYWGTAGMGGYFYVFDLETGDPVISVKTGGTRNFVQMDDLCFVAQKDPSKLLCIDLMRGEIVSECALPGRVTVNSRIAMIGRDIHVITFEYRKDKLLHAIWSCCSI